MSRLINRTERLREIETLLFRNSSGLSVPEIAAICGVDRRTIYRDLDLLSEAQVPIWQDSGRYGIIRDQYLATIRLKFNEAVALYIAARLLARHADEHNPHIVAALTKLAVAFPDPLSRYLVRTAQVNESLPVNSSFLAILETVASCWAAHYKVRLWYRSPRAKAIQERDVSPYTIEPSINGGLYVIGFDDTAQAIRTFKLERVERAEQIDCTYSIPDTFDPRSHFADAWGIMGGDNTVAVELRFNPSSAGPVQERLWHPSQQTELLPDGRLHFQVHVADLREMHPWIRSWGAEVEVLAPESLRAEMADQARALAQIYLV